MKFAASILLGLLAISAAQGKSLNPWEQKAKELEIKFEKVIDHKAAQVIDKVKTVVHHIQEDAKRFVEEVEHEINATIVSAIKEIEVLKLDVDIECYKNASRDIYAAQEAAANHLMGCKNLSAAYQDLEGIAQNATVVILDVVKDAKVILEGVAVCSVQVGFAKWQCAFKYVAVELRQLVSQWPDAKRFIAVVKTLGNDAQLQINTCLADPTQQSLNEKVQEALAEFSACAQKSASHFEQYVMY